MNELFNRILPSVNFHWFRIFIIFEAYYFTTIAAASVLLIFVGIRFSTTWLASFTLGARGFSRAVSGFGQVLKSDLREKPLDQSAIPLDSAEPITTTLIPKHLESGCFTDRFLGDIECFICSDWITITIGA